MCENDYTHITLTEEIDIITHNVNTAHKIHMQLAITVVLLKTYELYA